MKISKQVLKKFKEHVKEEDINEHFMSPLNAIDTGTNEICTCCISLVPEIKKEFENLQSSYMIIKNYFIDLCEAAKYDHDS